MRVVPDTLSSNRLLEQYVRYSSPNFGAVCRKIHLTEVESKIVSDVGSKFCVFALNISYTITSDFAQQRYDGILSTQVDASEETLQPLLFERQTQDTHDRGDINLRKFLVATYETHKAIGIYLRYRRYNGYFQSVSFVIIR